MTMVYIPWNSGGSLVDIAMKQIEPASALHFDPGDARLWVDGRESQLTPTQASMLRYFAFNSNRVISKQELLDMVWPDTHVTEALVKDYVRRLRRILDDDPSQPRFIETVRGMGYRFVGSVSISGVDDVTRSPCYLSPTHRMAIIRRIFRPASPRTSSPSCRGSVRWS
jgi:DNA-binding winged helix-turn-helix (wHTH) protein